ncbi:hypothetical protein A2U01_0066087, partial [Trifolium medium]|nr:hypothetical protein [Trifolium medium]
MGQKMGQISQSSRKPEEVKWINIPRVPKVEEGNKKSCVKEDIPREWDMCYAFHKEQQMHDKKSETL